MDFCFTIFIIAIAAAEAAVAIAIIINLYRSHQSVDVENAEPWNTDNMPNTLSIALIPNFTAGGIFVAGPVWKIIFWKNRSAVLAYCFTHGNPHLHFYRLRYFLNMEKWMAFTKSWYPLNMPGWSSAINCQSIWALCSILFLWWCWWW